MSNNIYICHTIYHLMITIIKINSEDDNILMIYGIENQCLLNRLVESGIFRKVYIYKNEESLDEQIKLLEAVENIYIFNDWTNIGMQLYYKKIKYHLIEDGYNYHQKKYDGLRKKFLGSMPRWRQVYNRLIGYPFFFGNNKYCLDIEVNSLDDLPQDKRKNKFKELPRKILFENIDERKKEELKKIFLISEMKKVHKSVLILTQPLYQDNLVLTSDEQYQFYKEICYEYFNKGYEIYLKIHPRDNVNYTNINNITIMDRFMPIELIELFSENSFDIGITHSSTALDFLNYIEKKIILYDRNLGGLDEKE